MSRRTLQLAAFDMIGTTVDAGDHVPSAFVEAFRRHGLELSEAEIATVRGYAKGEAVRELLLRRSLRAAESREQGDAITRTLQLLLREQLVAHARALPGAADTMRWLRERGVAVALGSGLERIAATSILRRLGWAQGVMDTLITADDVHRGRPEPEWIQVAMSRCQIEDAASVLVAGDTCADLAAAAAAGVGWSLGVLSGAHDRHELSKQPHTALLDHVGQLPQWVEAAGLL
jgi:phosphonatase-like hydrolase